MSVPQSEIFVKQKAEESAKIQREIQNLNKICQEYFATKTPKGVGDASQDAPMIKAVREKAKKKNLIF